MVIQKKNTFYYCVIALMTFLPSTTLFNMLRVITIAAIFLLTNKGDVYRISIGDMYTGKLVILLLVSPIISVLSVILLSWGNVNFNLFIHEYVRMVFNVLLILTVRQLTVSYKTCYRVAMLVLGVNFIIQVLQYNGNEAVFDFLEKWYVTGDPDKWNHLDLRFEGEQARYGSIYINPNVYTIVPIITLGLILDRDREKSSIVNYIMLIVAFLSCILTGSRTAMVVMAVIAIVYCIKYAAPSKLFPLLVTFCFGLAIYLAFYGDVSRAFSLELESSSSLSVKFQQFGWFWTMANPIWWLTGSIGAPVVGMDSEIGHIYAWYGVLGIYWYILLVKYISRVNRDRFVVGVSTIAFILVGLTSSVFLGFSVFTFFAAFVFANKVDNTLIISSDSTKQVSK